MRVPIMAANWKMNKTSGETREFIKTFKPLVADVRETEIVIAPPFTSLQAAADLLEGGNIRLAGQDVFYEVSGAYTGEVSPLMLKDAACSYVIVGHSERRQYFGETDETANRKAKAAQDAGLTVIFCIGETLEEREAGNTFDVLKRQTTEGLRGVRADGLVVAYEPVWAIGTGKTASPEQAQEAHRFIRSELVTMYGGAADTIRILYGGSVKPDNISSLMSKEDVDGALVGGASLKVDSFAAIVKYGQET
ncbi:MAG TPA: triose-phosphate isomerase [Nitrospirae bacterium]|nr:triose-phosphate isomerase [Nitrospirota bacterium]